MKRENYISTVTAVMAMVMVAVETTEVYIRRHHHGCRAATSHPTHL